MVVGLESESVSAFAALISIPIPIPMFGDHQEFSEQQAGMRTAASIRVCLSMICLDFVDSLWKLEGAGSAKKWPLQPRFLDRFFRNSLSRCPDRASARSCYQFADLSSANARQRCSSADRLRPPSATNKPIKPVRRSSSGFKVSQITATNVQFTCRPRRVQQKIMGRRLCTGYSQDILQGN